MSIVKKKKKPTSKTKKGLVKKLASNIETKKVPFFDCQRENFWTYNGTY